MLDIAGKITGIYIYATVILGGLIITGSLLLLCLRTNTHASLQGMA